MQGSEQQVLYTFKYWQYVDIFVYFSHHRVTIPPPCWTNAAHKNGVRMLGTLITEWEPGLKDTLHMLDAHLVSPEGDKIFRAVHKLGRSLFFLSSSSTSLVLLPQLSFFSFLPVVDIAEYHRFDGWLINIEVALKQEGAVEDMRLFVAQLTSEMHRRLPGSLVIWYDSVTKNGDLVWQDQLNDLNRDFFDACDGLFSNYCWKEDFPLTSAEVAGSRRRQVFMGCDIFGRNTFGGGGFHTHKALRVITRAKTSVALFAPGWTYETFERKDHPEVDRRFWIGDGQPATENTGSVADFIRPRPCPTPGRSLVCTFDRGFGERLFLNGTLLREGAFGHIHRQSVQPTWLPRPNAQKAVFEHTAERAFSGGTSLKVTLTASQAPLTQIFNLFLTHLEVRDSLRFFFAFSPLHSPATTKLGLQFTLNSEVTLTPAVDARTLGDGWVILTGPIFAANTGRPDGEFIREVSLVAEHQDTCANEVVFLGEIRIFDEAQVTRRGLLLNDDNTFEPEQQVISNLEAGDIVAGGADMTFLTLSWETAKSFVAGHFNIYSGTTFVGSAFCNSFRVSHAPPTGGHDHMEREGPVFTVQPVHFLAIPQQLSSCPRVQVQI